MEDSSQFAYHLDYAPELSILEHSFVFFVGEGLESIFYAPPDRYQSLKKCHLHPFPFSLDVGFFCQISPLAEIIPLAHFFELVESVGLEDLFFVALDEDLLC